MSLPIDLLIALSGSESEQFCFHTCLNHICVRYLNIHNILNLRIIHSLNTTRRVGLPIAWESRVLRLTHPCCAIFYRPQFFFLKQDLRLCLQPFEHRLMDMPSLSLLGDTQSPDRSSLVCTVNTSFSE